MVNTWSDRIPSRRSEWVDLLRGLAVIVMIEVHATNVWYEGTVPAWLNFINGLVAPSFLMCAGFSMTLSTFQTDDSLRSFKEVLPRYGFILLCAYLLHAPGLALAQWTVLSTPQLFRELFKIDVLQCVIFSLLILQGLARCIRHRSIFGYTALILGIAIAWFSPYLWITGFGEWLSLPVRGLFNGISDRGVTALFPLFPWFAFVAFGSALGALYASCRTDIHEDQSRWSESTFIYVLVGVGLVIWLWGQWQKDTWLWTGTWVTDSKGIERLNGWTRGELYALYNQTLPSVMERLGWVFMIGGFLGFIKSRWNQWKLFSLLDIVSRESLLVYILHLQIIFGILLYPFISNLTEWGWYSQNEWGTMVFIIVIIAINLVAAAQWHKIRKQPSRMRRLQFQGLSILLVWFLVGHWWTYLYYLKSPELATEPYPFLNAARIRKGLAPTSDGMALNEEEFRREMERRGKVYPEATLKKKLEIIRGRQP